MNVAVVTLYNALNYGSFLQAFSMCNFLKSKNINATLLDCSTNISKANITCNSIEMSICQKKTLNAFKKSWRLLPIKKNGGQIYDAVIIGSDEIWNIKNKYFEHWEEYFGYNVATELKIAYAPSIGYTSIDELGMKEIIGISLFDYVFPRDEETKLVAEKIRNESLETVVDPTLLMCDYWSNTVKKVKTESDYMIYYSYFNNPFLERILINFAHSNKLRLLTFLFKREWCDSTLYASPIEFVEKMQNAKYIITNTFHGTIFATLMNKQFLNFSLRHKTLNYLDFIGLGTSRLFTEEMDHMDFDKILKDEIDYTSVWDNIERGAKKSETVLLCALNNVKKAGEHRRITSG